MHYAYADRWKAAPTPRVFSGPLLDDPPLGRHHVVAALGQAQTG